MQADDPRAAHDPIIQVRLITFLEGVEMKTKMKKYSFAMLAVVGFAVAAMVMPPVKPGFCWRCGVTNQFVREDDKALDGWVNRPRHAQWTCLNCSTKAFSLRNWVLSGVDFTER